MGQHTRIVGVALWAYETAIFKLTFLLRFTFLNKLTHFVVQSNCGEKPNSKGEWLDQWKSKSGSSMLMNACGSHSDKHKYLQLFGLNGMYLILMKVDIFSSHL